MKVFNEVVSFKIENKFSKENFENEIMDYSDELEDLLDSTAWYLTRKSSAKKKIV